ncbi:MAG TPA: SDR family oxidoreductase, partial [Bryobacteraceae bacterium]|nr:SDR family oxidoreductase [Bryobacteraceae bacterium]
MTARGNQSILVTGAGRGLGLETALVLAQAGFRVWAGIRDFARRDALLDAGAKRGVKLEPVRLDITDPLSVDEAFQSIARSGQLYGVVNNAGVTARAYFEDFPEERARQIIEVNLFGTMNVTRRALPLLRQAGNGRIVMISSVGGRIGSMSVAPYCASKFGLEGFSEALALEMKPFGIDVVIIEPGIVNTEIWEEERRLLPATRDPQSPYFRLFWNAEAQAEKMLRSSRLTPADIAAQVLRAITVKKPRLRYVVGRRARLVLALRRHLPGELFERLYFGELLRRATRGDSSAHIP